MTFPGSFRQATRGLSVTLTLAFLAVAIAALPASAQNDKMVPIATPAQPDAIVLNTGPLPGATAPESWHSQYGSVFARNVSVATLTPFLPSPEKATGAAVIVAPVAVSAPCPCRTRAGTWPRRWPIAAWRPSC